MLLAARRRLDERHEAETHELADSLHDAVLQPLLAVHYQLALALQCAGAGHQSGEQAGDATALVQAAHASVLEMAGRVRELLGGLRPGGLEEWGLRAALEAYIAQLRRAAPTPMPRIELLAPEAVEIALPLARCLFLVAQEMLDNALRHAQAHHISVQLWADREAVMLRTRDDGCGFVLPPDLGEFMRSDRFGLLIAVERAAAARGKLTIRSRIEGGTDVSVRLPTGQHGRASDRAVE